MKVLLTQNVDGFGKKGEIKNAADGYARNFLFPKKLAVPATAEAIKGVADEKATEEKKLQKGLEDVKSMAEKLKSVELTLLLSLGEEGQAFGSISSQDIAEALQKKGFNVKKDHIVLEEPIKKTGGWDIQIKLPHGIESSIKVVVEAKKLFKKTNRERKING